MDVSEAVARERIGEALPREVWKPPRGGHDPDIGDLRDLVPAQEGDEVVKRVGRMADGVEDHDG